MSSDSPTPGEPAGRTTSGNGSSGNPATGEATPGRAVGGLERAALEAARLELEASQRQIAELEELLNDLPTIFERKFGERIEPLIERQRLLLDDNHALHDRLSRLLPQAGETGGSPAAVEPPEATVAETDPAPEPLAQTQAPEDQGPGQPNLPSLPQLRRGRPSTSRLMGQNGRVS